MGYPLYNNALTDGSTGVLLWRGERIPWADLRRRGQEIRDSLLPSAAYAVDPSAGPAAFAAFFAVASLGESMLIWCDPARLDVPSKALSEGLRLIDRPDGAPSGRPLWGISTSGTSGPPKVPVGYADTLGMVTLYYEEAVFAPALGARASTFATCLPLQFSAAFFMAVLPAALSGRDLLVFPPHDWRPVVEAARRGPVVCQSVPAITAAGALSLGEPVNASNLLILMGGGYATEPRVKSVRDRFRGAILGNIYGTAETGALSIDWTPGEVDHVGRPITGKPVWVLDPNEQGIGVIATTGPDCRRFQWTPGSSIEELGDIASGTDYGHFSDDGYLYLDGRLDGGEKLHGVTVYPRAVERHILRLPGVIDVRVTVRRTGGVDQLVARVVGDLTPAEVQEGCAQRQEIERPTRVECFPERDALSAYSANGKL